MQGSTKTAPGRRAFGESGALDFCRQVSVVWVFVTDADTTAVFDRFAQNMARFWREPLKSVSVSVVHDGGDLIVSYGNGELVITRILVGVSQYEGRRCIQNAVVDCTGDVGVLEVHMGRLLDSTRRYLHDAVMALDPEATLVKIDRAEM